MRRRLYFLLPDVESARKTEDELLLARVEERHIHFVAREDVELGRLPEATVVQRSDLLHAMLIGLVAGGVTGVMAGVVIYLLPAAEIGLGLGVILGTAILGAIIGTWVSGMIGISVPNSRLRPFDGAVSGGQILMMVDVPKGRVEEIVDLMHKTHPEAADRGMEMEKPAFP